MRGKFRLFPEKYGYFPYIWLIYLVFPIRFLMLETDVKRIVGYLLLAIFVVSYRQAYATTKTFEIWLLLHIGIIFIYSSFYNINYLFMNFYAASFISYARTKTRYLQLYVIFVIAVITPFFFTVDTWGNQDIYYMLPFIVLMMVFPFGMRMQVKRRQLENELHEANAQINELVKREERQRIARDLHDTLGHTLSLLTLKSQLVERVASSDPDRAKQEAREIQTISRAALKQVRELIADMRSNSIQEEMVQAKGILQAAGITCFYEEGAEKQFPLLLQNTLSMCLREAVTNVVKHSKASRCEIKIEQEKSRILLTVSDNGIGIQENDGAGNGMKGMQERLSFLDGTLTCSTGETGTFLICSVPLVIRGKERNQI